MPFPAVFFCAAVRPFGRFAVISRFFSDQESATVRRLKALSVLRCMPPQIRPPRKDKRADRPRFEKISRKRLILRLRTPPLMI